MTNSEPTGSTAGELLHESRFTAIQLAILILCMIASMIEGFDIVVIAYTAPAIAADWGVPAGELGVVFSAGVFGMTLGAMLLAWLADRYGRRIVVSGALLVSGLATAAVALSQTVAELVILRVIAGVALGALVATLPALAGEFSPSRHRTLIISILIASANIGGFAGGLIAAEIIDDHGWRGIFLYAGIITIVTALLIQLLTPESVVFVARRGTGEALKQVNRSLAYIGHATVEALPVFPGQGEREAASVRSLLTPARRSGTVLIWSAFFLGFLVVYFISSWMPKILADSGLSQQEAIRGSTALPLGAILGNILIGWLSKTLGLERLIMLAFIAGAVFMAVLSAMNPQLASLPFILTWGMLFFTGVTLLGAFGNLYNVALRIYPVQIRGTGIGWAAGLGRAGAVASPALAGLLIGAGLSMPSLFLLFGLPALVAAACMGSLRARK